MIIVDSDSVAAAFTALHEEYVQAEEAAKALLPIVNFVTRDVLAFEIIDWEPRHEQFLGPRTLPLPTCHDVCREGTLDLPA